MTRTYSRTNCFWCGKRHSQNGLARINHLRKHVRQGFLSEYKDVDGYIHFVLVSIDLWKVHYPSIAIQKRGN